MRHKMFHVLFISIATCLCSPLAAALEVNPIDCFNNGWNKQKLLLLKEAKFETTDQNRQILVSQLHHCLASPDPEVRDGVAYEAYFTWLRDEKITAEQLKVLFERLTKALENRRSDKQGVYLPFVALVYSEVVRVDRINSYLSEEQRQRSVNAIVQYLKDITDYRGFDDKSGWRHGVAHSADVVLQLALNSNVDGAMLSQLAQGMKAQIVPESGHFYIYGEPERLARATAYAMLREDLSLEYWQTWLVNLADPAPFEEWGDVFKSQQGLAMRNNLRQFLTNLYTMIAASQNERLVTLTPLISEHIRATG
ncbi:MAG: DUF2785 domain-containing protein [Aestuariibacter sp.]